MTESAKFVETSSSLSPVSFGSEESTFSYLGFWPRPPDIKRSFDPDKLFGSTFEAPFLLIESIDFTVASLTIDKMSAGEIS